MNPSSNPAEHPKECPKCSGTGKILRPFTIQDLIERLPQIMDSLSAIGQIPDKKIHFFLSKRKIRFPKMGTEASEDFFATLLQISDFFSFLLNLVNKADIISTLIEYVFTLPDGSKLVKADSKALERDTEVASKELSKNRPFLLEVICIRIVESYLTYLSTLLYVIFTERPETMKSSEKVDLETILSQDSLDSLIRTLAEHKITNLSYNSFKVLSHYFLDRFNLKICNDKDLKEIIFAIEFRNIAVHNRSRISNRFIRNTGEEPKNKGLKIEIGIQYIQDIAHILFESVKSLDINSRKKLKLKGKRLSTQNS